MSKKLIEVSDLVKTYKKAKVNAVDGVTFDVKEGEFFAFLGPNGAGKTTTLSILTTILAKTSGVVKVNGLDIDEDSGKIRKMIGVIFQNPSLDLNLSAEENIRFHAILYGLYPYRPTYNMMPEGYKKRVKKLAGVLDLDDRIFNKVKVFSGGMRRKLEIIRSLMHSPRVLYLDEPTSGLDPESRKKLWQYLAEVRGKEKTTMFLTTHYLEEAEDADRVAIINKGKIISMGTPSEIKKDLVKNYLIIDARDRDALIAELKNLKFKYKVADKVSVNINSNDVQRIIKRIKTKLNYIDIQKPTLEEAYLEIIGRENNKLPSL